MNTAMLAIGLTLSLGFAPQQNPSLESIIERVSGNVQVLEFLRSRGHAHAETAYNYRVIFNSTPCHAGRDLIVSAREFALCYNDVTQEGIVGIAARFRPVINRPISESPNIELADLLRQSSSKAQEVLMRRSLRSLVT